jgi:RNA polymerase sigma factor (TIGR02999 family)
MAELTTLLTAARQGDEQAAGTAFSLIYDDLRRLAHARLRQHQTITLLDTTCLVHEAYLKIAGVHALNVEDRHHFFTYASTVMRTVIVDFARAQSADRRGGDAQHVAIDTDLSDQLAIPASDVLRVHEALESIGRIAPDLTQLVEMRYFGGLTDSEIAEVLGISERTVRRNWGKARMLLTAAL